MELIRGLKGFHKQFSSVVCPVDYVAGVRKDYSSVEIEHVAMKVADVFRYSGATPSSFVRSDQNIASQQADDYVMSLPLTSEFGISQFGREASVPPGSFAIVSTSQPFGSFNAAPDPGFREFIVKIPGPLLRRLVPYLDQCCAIPVAVRRGPTAFMKAMVESICDNGRALRSALPDAYGLMLVRAIGLALIDAPELRGRVDDHLPTAQVRLCLGAEAFIESNLANPSLDPMMVAEYCRVSLRSLYAAFEAFGKTVAGTIREMRLQSCRNALLDPALRNQPVAKIALNAGYLDATSFSRAYRRRFGKSPRNERLQ